MYSYDLDASCPCNNDVFGEGPCRNCREAMATARENAARLAEADAMDAALARALPMVPMVETVPARVTIPSGPRRTPITRAERARRLRDAWDEYPY